MGKTLYNLSNEDLCDLMCGMPEEEQEDSMKSFDLQLFGGRGSSSSGGASGEVPYDKWGKDIGMMEGFENRKIIYDENGNDVGSEHFEDYTAYISVPIVQEATVSQIVKDINGWKNDDGTYGGEDVYISVEYADGTHINNEADNFGKVYAKNKRSIVGASISTADYEAAAGKTKTSRGWVDMETSEDSGGRTYANSALSYVPIGKYKKRTKITYLEGSYAKKHGKRTVTYQTVRKSTVKPIDIPKKLNNGYGKTLLIDRNNPL